MMNSFEKFTKTRMKPYVKSNPAYYFIGLAGEVGEVMEWYKKSVLRGDERFTHQDLLHELGDVIHYLTGIGNQYGWTLEDMKDANIAKLTAREPQTVQNQPGPTNQ